MERNYMEILVEEVYNEIKGIRPCEYEECDRDIMAIALNNLPPKYFTSSVSDGERRAFLVDRQLRITVLTALTQARDILLGKKVGEGR